MSIVTGILDVHTIVDSYTRDLPFKYLTVEEMSILFPHLTPLTYKAKQFKADPMNVAERVAKRFGVYPSERSFNNILQKHKIEDVYVMS